VEQSNTILNRLTQICGYADYILVTVRNLSGLEAMSAEVSREVGIAGPGSKPHKTKCMRFSAFPSRRLVKRATINGVTYEGVAEIIYFDSLISNDVMIIAWKKK
jgi:hypothetical protein